MNSYNKWVSSILKDFLSSLPQGQRYFCIGSVSLLSFTGKNYDRKIKDIDIICDIPNFETVKNRLQKLGYKQYTFVDKKFFFYKQLMKLAESKYYRFEKDGKNLEIMTSDFGNSKKEIFVEIYPGIKFSFPATGIIDSLFKGINFKSVSSATLYCIYSLGLKTWGRFVKTRIEQRKTDLDQLKKIVDKNKLGQIAENIFLQIGLFRFKIPTRFIL